jgi:RNA polymerase sigma factor (sigma-70 family)
VTIQRETLWTEVDEDGFEAVFDRYAKAVYNHAFRLTGSWSVAEDVTQATFLTAWRRRTEVRLVDGSPLPWLLVTAGHQARTEQRTLTRWRNRLLRAPGDDTVADPADDVAGRLDDERRMRQVLEAVRGLPRAEREAVALCLWSGVSYAEAATVLGVAESSVRSRVSRARARLTRNLTDPAGPAPPASPAEPATRAPERAARTAEPATRAPERAARTAEPATRAPAPAARTAEPATRVAEPATRGPGLAVRTPELAARAAEVAAHTPEEEK